ncbi:50S ribosomal protein L11 methyltransferase [Candidatus Curtissbacteria bacterium]|nr:50S ribosomal protein L11 methyltransferase [Candidatus Curtissbacteria bacterium]
MQILIATLLIVIMLLLLFIIVGFFFFLFDIFLELPYVATKRHKIETIIKFAQIKPGQTVVDLGSGDGRLLIASAAKGANAIGYEINPFLIGITLVHAKIKGLADHLKVYKSNLWKSDLAVADVVFVYGRKKTMQKFQDFVWQNAKKGTRVIVNTNPFPTKKPIKEKNAVYLYKV